jgi:hypothetical protein
MPEIPITQQMLLLIAEIDEFKGKWRALNALAPDRPAALRKIATVHILDLAKEHGRITT